MVVHKRDMLEFLHVIELVLLHGNRSKIYVVAGILSLIFGTILNISQYMNGNRCIKNKVKKINSCSSRKYECISTFRRHLVMDSEWRGC